MRTQEPLHPEGGLSLSLGRITKNTLSVLAAYGLGWGTKAIVAVVVARSLGPRGLGDFSLAWTVASMLGFFAPLGLTTLLIREMNRRDGANAGITMPLAILLGTVFGTALAVLPSVLGARPVLAQALAAGALYVALTPPTRIYRAMFHAAERMEIETATTAVEGAVGLVGVTVALSMGAGVAGALLALGVGLGANLVVSAVIARRRFGRLGIQLTPRRWPTLLRASLPMGIAYAFTTLVLRFDIVLLGAMRSSREVGIYSAASVLVMAVPVLAGSLSSALYPVFSRARGAADPHLDEVFARAWRLLAVGGLVGAVGFAVLARPLVDLLYGSGFAASVAVLASLAWVLPWRFVNTLLGTTLNAVDRQAQRMGAVGAAAAFNLATNLVLIPLYGYWGAVISTIATELALTIALVWAVRPLAVELTRPLVEGIAIAGATAIALWLVPGHVIVRGLVGVAVAAAATAIRLGPDLLALRADTSTVPSVSAEVR